MLTLTTYVERFYADKYEQPLNAITAIHYDGSVALISFTYGKANSTGYATVQNAADAQHLREYTLNQEFFFIPYQEIPFNLSTYFFPRREVVLDKEKLVREIETVNECLLTQVFPVKDGNFYKQLLKEKPERIHPTRIYYAVRTSAMQLLLAMKEKRFTLPQVAYGSTSKPVLQKWTYEETSEKNCVLAILTDACLFEKDGVYYLPTNTSVEFESFDRGELQVRAIHFDLTWRAPRIAEQKVYQDWVRRYGFNPCLPETPETVVLQLEQLESSFERNVAPNLS